MRELLYRSTMTTFRKMQLLRITGGYHQYPQPRLIYRHRYFNVSATKDSNNVS